jgi:hypothetical protein
MQLPSAATATAPAGAYTKVDRMDAEEARHLKAQYLIHKVLEEAAAATAASARRRPPALARVRATERKSHNYLRARSLLKGFHWLHAGVGPTMHADMLPTSDFYIVHGSHQVKACEAQNLPPPRRGRLPGPSPA